MMIDEEEADGIEEWIGLRGRMDFTDRRPTTTTSTTTNDNDDDERPTTDDDDDIEYIQWPQTIRPTVATRGDDTV